MEGGGGTGGGARGVGRAKPTLWILGGLLLAGAVLWTAWRLDEMERPTRAPAPADGAGRGDFFVVEVKEEPRPVIVIECEEGVQADANARFREFLGISSPPLAIPGGPMLLARLPEELSEEQGPVARSAVEVLKRWSPRKVVLVAHSECLLYDVAGAWEGQPGLVPVAQAADLQRAAKHLRAWLPRTEVEAYFARKDGARIRFNPVPLDASGEVR